MPFIIHVVCHIHSHLQPSYICEGNEKSSDVVSSSSMAITSVYQAIFGTKTKFAGLSYLDLKQPEIFQKLLENDSQIIAEYKDSSPNAVWNQTGVLKSFPGNTLFAINHPMTLQQLDQIYKAKFNYQTLIPNECTFVDWNNKTIMGHLFDLHLKKAVEDHDTLKNLYKNGFLNTSSQSLSTAESFWNCFHNSYDANFRGIDGKIYILSIIVESFTYQELMDKLE
ncbi:15669_t:CDS:2, partial [Dentiscutata heterogama]